MASLNPEPAPLTETQARIVLAQDTGKGGGYVATRYSYGWVFSPALRRRPAFGDTSWLVTDSRQTAPLDQPGISLRDLADEMNSHPTTIAG